MTNYALKLVNGHVVKPGFGGFYWYYKDGRGAGGIGSLDYLIPELARKAFGGVAVTRRFDDSETVIEFYPISQIESVQAYTEPVQLSAYR